MSSLLILAGTVGLVYYFWPAKEEKVASKHPWYDIKLFGIDFGLANKEGTSNDAPKKIDASLRDTNYLYSNMGKSVEKMKADAADMQTEKMLKYKETINRKTPYILPSNLVARRPIQASSLSGNLVK